MPNIIINNYCNQKCSYCFANENMKDKNLQKDMNISTYLKILKFLNNNNDKNVRILGGEPLLSPNIRKILQIANKGGFNIIIFSNINIDNYKLINDLSGFNGMRINCNINDKDFYNKKEIINIEKNLESLNNLGLKVIIGYNIIQNKNNPDFIFKLAKKHNIKAINIKITNSPIGGKLIIDNSSKDLGIYIFKLIKKYHSEFFLEFSCGLDINIFTISQIEYINNNTSIKLNFGCDGNIGKFDINTDGKLFKCFPLEILFKKDKYSPYNIDNIVKNNIPINQIIQFLNKGLKCNGECSSNKKIKEKI